MTSSTLKFSIVGTTHYEIMSLVEAEIATYLGTTTPDLSRYVNYEVVVEKSEGGKYTANVVARIKNGTK